MRVRVSLELLPLPLNVHTKTALKGSYSVVVVENRCSRAHVLDETNEVFFTSKKLLLWLCNFGRLIAVVVLVCMCVFHCVFVRNVMRSTRGNSLKLLKPRHRLNVRGNYFAKTWKSGEPLEQPPGQCGNSTIGWLLQEKTGQALGSTSFNVRPRMSSLNCDINDLFGSIPDHRGQSISVLRTWTWSYG